LNWDSSIYINREEQMKELLRILSSFQAIRRKDPVLLTKPPQQSEPSLFNPQEEKNPN